MAPEGRDFLVIAPAILPPHRSFLPPRRWDATTRDLRRAWSIQCRIRVLTGTQRLPPRELYFLFSGLSNLADVSLIPEGGEAVQAQKGCLLWGPKVSMSHKQDEP